MMDVGRTNMPRGISKEIKIRRSDAVNYISAVRDAMDIAMSDDAEFNKTAVLGMLNRLIKGIGEMGNQGDDNE